MDWLGEWSEQDRAFQEALGAEDELGLVVRAHIHIESLLNQLIEVVVVDSKALGRMQLDYSQRVHLAQALGMDSDLAKPLQALGKLRNDFAHKLDMKLKVDRVDAFYETFPASIKKILHDSLEVSLRKLLRRQVSFKQSPPDSKFIMLVMPLRVAMQFEIRRAKQERAAS